MHEYKNQSPVFPYTEREAMHSDAAVETLSHLPELQLSPEQRTVVRQFGESLMSGPLDEEGKPAGASLETILNMAVLADEQTYDIDFLTSSTDIARSAREMLGVPPGAESPDAIEGELCKRMAERTLPPVSDRRKITQDGEKWRQERLTAALAGDPSHDNAFISDKTVTINADPYHLR